ncbi:hypothetical protein B0J18DRAFT_452733 [Chaetomium sp. MPI-SDFR-AT-0129]|nr:hypothetical protein B0J18DRAFT_452733 [Chaetomium sp. MPI-SDFR-AT-0129]
MRNLLSYLLLALLNLQKQAAAQSTGQYCDSTSQVCYLQYSWGTTIPVFRLAVPDSASTGGNYDTLLQVVAPVSVKWAGFSWGGGMTSNPLTVVWPNGNSATVSSRWASSRTLPTVYSSATYKTVSASNNGTHWTVETVCSGCSTWSGGSLSTTGTDTFAWAVGRNAVSQPADPSSSFSVHDTIGTFSGALSQGTVPQATFDEHIKNAS